MTLDYWVLFPASILIATLAMASGIGGAVFFSPIFLLVLKLEPNVAIGTALLTELFGFGSGLVAYLRARLIDFKLGLSLIAFSIPASILGVFFADRFPGVVLKTAFAVGLIFIGIQMYNSWRQDEKERLNREISEEGADDYESSLTDSSGRTYRYTVCNKGMGRAFAAVGGAFLGMISVGLAELQEYHLVAKCRVPSSVAVATSIFVVISTVLVASAGHLYGFATSAESGVLRQVINVAVFTVPGVLIGGQIGPRLQAHLNPDVVKVGIAGLFVVVGLFMLTTLVQ